MTIAQSFIVAFGHAALLKPSSARRALDWLYARDPRGAARICNISNTASFSFADGSWLILDLSTGRLTTGQIS